MERRLLLLFAVMALPAVAAEPAPRSALAIAKAVASRKAVVDAEAAHSKALESLEAAKRQAEETDTACESARRQAKADAEAAVKALQAELGVTPVPPSPMPIVEPARRPKAEAVAPAPVPAVRHATLILPAGRPSPVWWIEDLYPGVRLHRVDLDAGTLEALGIPAAVGLALQDAAGNLLPAGGLLAVPRSEGEFRRLLGGGE